MAAPEITLATEADREGVVCSLVAAFAQDPALRYFFPADSTYPDYATALFGHLYDKRVGRGSVWTIGGGASVAIWEPPATENGPGEDNGLADLPADEQARVLAYNEAVHNRLPSTAFWYLGVLGTHPKFAGRRWGHALMSAGLRRASEDGLPAMLETSNPVNVDMYRRAGWRVVRSATHPLPIWLMQHWTD